MLKNKTPRTKGKFSFTKYFQKFKEGDSVAVVRELSLPLNYPKKLQGRTGKVLAKRGEAYYVEIKDLNKPKRYLIRPVHLKKIEQVQAK
jgi:large subunit ribosomal protein L21e